MDKKLEVLGLKNSISLLPRTNNNQSEYRSNDIFCFPSRYEGFPLVLMEAISFGVVRVAFNCPRGPSDLIENGKNGFLSEPFNIEDFTSTLQLIMENKDLQDKMSFETEDFIRNNFSEDVIMHK